MDTNSSQDSILFDLSTSDFAENEMIVLTDEEQPVRCKGMTGDLRSIEEIHAPVVISAPTGSGKTIIFELAIVQLLIQISTKNYTGEFKIIYIAPVKALCNERLEDWYSKFAPFGLTTIVITGDSDNADYNTLQNYNIILTTPEKWDALTRKWRDNKKLVQVIKLFLIDEVHLLNEEDRGPILEAVVSRMKTIQETAKYDKNRPQLPNDLPARVRFVAVSATIPNIEDVAKWLGFPEQPAVYYKISEDLRPVKLNKIVLGYPCAPNTPPFKFDLSLNYKLRSVIMQYTSGKPILIFCSTRKGVELAAQHIANEITLHLSPEKKKSLSDAAADICDNKLRKFLLHGVGFHHAGLTQENRYSIESLFRQGNLPILVTTSTLAIGVNLPANLVIVKSTQHYVDCGYKDYSESTLLQMIGRAGRPQFDSSATAVIMTKLTEKTRYEKMVGGSELVESSLHRHLRDHLNAEVVLHTITDLAVALDWLRSTYLYVRALKNPKHYGMATCRSKPEIEKKLQDLCQIEMNALSRNGMITVDQEDGFDVSPSYTGILMARFYMAFDTMKLFQKISGNEGLFDVLSLISNSHEFSLLFLRRNDKKTLNTLNRCKNRDTIRFPLPGKIQNIGMKVNCIIQSVFGCLKILDPSLLQETTKIMKIGEKVANCLVEYLQKKQKCFNVLLNTIILSKCFHTKLWENSIHITRQLENIGPVLSSMLVASGKTTFKAILDSNPRELERIINRAPPMGNQIQNEVSHLPLYEIRTKKLRHCNKVKVEVILKNADKIGEKCTAGLNSCMILLVGDSENNVLLHQKYQHSVMLSRRVLEEEVELIDSDASEIKSYLISNNWVGIDCNTSISLCNDLDFNDTKVGTTQDNIVSSTILKDAPVSQLVEEPSENSPIVIDLYDEDIELSKIATNTSQSDQQPETPTETLPKYCPKPFLDQDYMNKRQAFKTGFERHEKLINRNKFFSLLRETSCRSSSLSNRTGDAPIDFTQFKYLPRKKMPKYSENNCEDDGNNNNEELTYRIVEVVCPKNQRNEALTLKDSPPVKQKYQIPDKYSENKCEEDGNKEELTYSNVEVVCPKNQRNEAVTLKDSPPVKQTVQIPDKYSENKCENDGNKEELTYRIVEVVCPKNQCNDAVTLKDSSPVKQKVQISDQIQELKMIHHKTPQDFKKYLTERILENKVTEDKFDFGVNDFILSLYTNKVVSPEEDTKQEHLPMDNNSQAQTDHQTNLRTRDELTRILIFNDDNPMTNSRDKSIQSCKNAIDRNFMTNPYKVNSDSDSGYLSRHKYSLFSDRESIDCNNPQDLSDDRPKKYVRFHNNFDKEGSGDNSMQDGDASREVKSQGFDRFKDNNVQRETMDYKIRHHDWSQKMAQYDRITDNGNLRFNQQVPRNFVDHTISQGDNEQNRKMSEDDRITEFEYSEEEDITDNTNLKKHQHIRGNVVFSSISPNGHNPHMKMTQNDRKGHEFAESVNLGTYRNGLRHTVHSTTSHTSNDSNRKMNQPSRIIFDFNDHPDEKLESANLRNYYHNHDLRRKMAQPDEITNEYTKDEHLNDHNKNKIYQNVVPSDNITDVPSEDHMDNSDLESNNSENYQNIPRHSEDAALFTHTGRKMNQNDKLIFDFMEYPKEERTDNTNWGSNENIPRDFTQPCKSHFGKDPNREIPLNDILTYIYQNYPDEELTEHLRNYQNIPRKTMAHTLGHDMSRKMESSSEVTSFDKFKSQKPPRISIDTQVHHPNDATRGIMTQKHRISNDYPTQRADIYHKIRRKSMEHTICPNGSDLIRKIEPDDRMTYGYPKIPSNDDEDFLVNSAKFRDHQNMRKNFTDNHLSRKMEQRDEVKEIESRKFQNDYRKSMGECLSRKMEHSDDSNEYQNEEFAEGPNLRICENVPRNNIESANLRNYQNIPSSAHAMYENSNALSRKMKELIDSADYENNSRNTEGPSNMIIKEHIPELAIDKDNMRVYRNASSKCKGDETNHVGNDIRMRVDRSDRNAYEYPKVESNKITNYRNIPRSSVLYSGRKVTYNSSGCGKENYPPPEIAASSCPNRESNLIRMSDCEFRRTYKVIIDNKPASPLQSQNITRHSSNPNKSFNFNPVFY